MGKIQNKINEIKSIEKSENLVKRFKKTVAAQAIREYLGMKVENILVFEVKALEEEIILRLGKLSPIFRIDIKKVKSRKNVNYNPTENV